MSIVTDSGGKRPEHVYAIHKLLKSEAELQELYESNKGKYKAVKDALVEDLDSFIKPMRERREQFASNPDSVITTLQAGAEVARKKSEEKMKKVRTAIGVS